MERNHFLYTAIEDVMFTLIPTGIPQHFYKYHLWYLYDRYHNEELSNRKFYHLIILPMDEWIIGKVQKVLKKQRSDISLNREFVKFDVQEVKSITMDSNDENDSAQIEIIDLERNQITVKPENIITNEKN
ncbi:hypothetical protein PVAND_010627 [Polypedilum vanderplanki]|uniref:Uncharacterized protein n=1 Tax=Polypedilum vanderplanki TaxID=319348 RepID=A0A9J6CG57_POLVA|nr:hypothetical protein PVAND_010627 [Polypedilum vanderplanki]